MPSQDSYELGGYAEDDVLRCTTCGRKIYSLELSGYCQHCWSAVPQVVQEPPPPIREPILRPDKHGICPDCEGRGYMDGEVISLGRGVRSRKQDICMRCLGRGRV